MEFPDLEWELAQRYLRRKGYLPPTINLLSKPYDADPGTANSVTTEALVGDYTGLTVAAYHTGYTVALTLTDNASGRFSMEAGTHAIQVLSSPLDSGSYTVTLQAASSDGVSITTEIFTIVVTEGLPSLDFSEPGNSQYLPFF